MTPNYYEYWRASAEREEALRVEHNDLLVRLSDLLGIEDLNKEELLCVLEEDIELGQDTEDELTNIMLTLGAHRGNIPEQWAKERFRCIATGFFIACAVIGSLYLVL